MFKKLIVFALSIFAPEVDAGNVAAAEEHGLEVFINADGEETICEDVPLALQHYRCKERMRWALLTISNRESAGNWSPQKRYTGEHAGDSWAAPRVRYWAGKFKRTRAWCPIHWTAEGFSTVGPHGLMYGYHVQRLGVIGNCVPTWVFGIGHVSADMAAELYSDVCGNPEGHGWCPTLEQTMKTKRRAKRRGYDRHVLD